MTRLIGIDLAAGPDRSVVTIAETLPNGAVRITEIDDVVDIRPWGDGLVVRMKTRDPVLIRKDGACCMLVTDGGLR